MFAHKNSTEKIEIYLEYFKKYIWFKQHYNINLPAEICGVAKKFDYITVKLSDIKRLWKGKVLSLDQCAPYLYLETHDKRIYEDYINEHIEMGLCPENCNWKRQGCKKIDDLFKSIKKTGYDPTQSIIVIDEQNIVVDGQHRACCLMLLMGKDAEIPVVKITR